MIFLETWRQVLDGTKTQTRRLRRSYYKEGGVYAVQPSRGKAAIGRIRITGIWERPLHRTTDIEAQAEGFAGKIEFFEAFTRINKLSPEWVLLEPFNVWVFEFELAEWREK